MYVAEFIQILHRYISLGTNQPAFLEELICHASLSYKTECFDKNDRYSESRFKDFCRGDVQGNEIVGDHIGFFACKFLRVINKESLDQYLAIQIKKSGEDSRLRTVFQEDFSKLPPDAAENDIIKDDKGNNIAEETVQLAKQIRRLFVHVINDCIREYSRKRHKGKASTSSTSDISRSYLDGRHKEAETYESGMEYNPLHAVDSSLNKLIKIGRMIAEYEKENAFGKIPAFRSPLRSELQSEFERLRQLADTLLTSEESSATSAFDEIAMIIFHLTADTFVLTEFEYRIITPQNERLHQLLDLVMQLRTDFTPSNNNTPIN